ncbi:3-oxoacyl-ACP synthase [Brumimicrobium aurantiacum]|uniref:3-oxoacyl-ACP synthase n=1 Tax=Brumimicrobium aurantiacum TaxID=1737063 RepID=A0A3E1EWL4_9FLAO|nr:3-oxoacyl-ACP synthase [Brumimicrobium aurantiacum]RFC53950.1 3-oxoacyl-ACP synthase [Brumimicrobium aurantiacum]
MNAIKTKVIEAIREELNERLEVSTQAYNDAKESRNNDTKSSAGDKYETSRAMMQQEMDNAEVSIHQVKMFKNELQRLPVEEESDIVISGSLVETDKGLYFLGLSLGKIEVDNQIIYAISTASPLGKLLLHKNVGDEINLNNMKQSILSIC